MTSATERTPIDSMSYRRFGLRLGKLLRELDQHLDAIPLDELQQLVVRSELTERHLQRFAQFDQACYRRNVIYSGPAYQALVLCWRSGQRSPIHDHRGSACVIRVLAGVCSETLFERSDSGLIFPTTTSHSAAGCVMGSFDADIHQVANLQRTGIDLVTLHVYSPPLLKLRTYRLGDSIRGEDDRMLVRKPAAAERLRSPAHSPRIVQRLTRIQGRSA